MENAHTISIPWNMHTVCVRYHFCCCCFIVGRFYTYHSVSSHWHLDNLPIAPGPVKQSSNISVNRSHLTHCGLVVPYDVIYFYPHWFRQWLDTWWHQTITWTKSDLSSNVFCVIHWREISQDGLMNSICNICSEITPSKLCPQPPGANPLRNNKTKQHRLINF